MKDRGWPHARSTAGSPDANIAIGREGGGGHRPQEGRGQAHFRPHRSCRALDIELRRQLPRQLPSAPSPYPTSLCPRAAEPARTAVRRAGRRGAATLPAPSRWGATAPSSLAPIICMGRSQAPGCFSRILGNRDTATAVWDEALGKYTVRVVHSVTVQY